MTTIDEIEIQESLDLIKDELIQKGFDVKINPDISELTSEGIPAKNIIAGVSKLQESSDTLLGPENLREKLFRIIAGKKRKISVEIFKFGKKLGGSITYFLACTREEKKLVIGFFKKDVAIVLD